MLGSDKLKVDLEGHVVKPKQAGNYMNTINNIAEFLHVHGSTNRRAPGCVNAAGKLRQKW